MDDRHPITPPPELMELLRHFSGTWRDQIIIAYRAGADMELDACCEWVEREIRHGRRFNVQLRAARRPKPPSLKEQAMQAWCRFQDTAHKTADEMMGDMTTIRRALEQLDD